MSRTPESIVNKKAESWRDRLVIAGIIAWLLAFGAFANEGQAGTGVACALIGLALFWGASKIKVVWHKRGQVDIFE